MRRTKLLLLVALLLGVGVANAEETTDRVVISDLVVEPGGDGEAVFTVSLEGSLQYTAYQVSLALPEGLEVSIFEGEYDVHMLGTSGFYPRDGQSHSLGANVVAGNVLNVTCFSSTNAKFAKTSGDLFKVYVKASPYLKPGDVNIEVKGVKLVTVDETKYEPTDYVNTAVQASATSTLLLKVSDVNKYGTCILPFDYELPADGLLEAYTCDTYTDEALVLTKASKIAAYTPYIVYSENGFEASLSGAVDATKYPEGDSVKSGYLVGTLVQTELTEGSYVMQNQGNGSMFYRVGSVPFALSAGKCYVELPAGTNVASLRIDGSTDIESIHNSEKNNHKSEIINLLGQPVTHMLPGRVYIVNGRKVISGKTNLKELSL